MQIRSILPAVSGSITFLSLFNLVSQIITIEVYVCTRTPRTDTYTERDDRIQTDRTLSGYL